MSHHFRHTASVSVGSIPISKHRSPVSGLSVVFVGLPSPLVNGYFVVATEATDDKGLPHTLEHLVFLGSEEYPFRGFLDTLSNRCLARGTNAWTATDHTCYTVSTAGAQGFASVLPVFAEHILFPSLTSCGFTTEIHHVDGKGEDGGVVYCEMQGRENGAMDILIRHIQRALFSGSGYSSETGGLMQMLRTLTPEDIRKYHKDYYTPANLTLIITGPVDHAGTLASLMPLEAKLASHVPSSPAKRPWVDSPPVPPFTTTREEVVEFPDEDEAVGTVYVCWRSTEYGQFLEGSALDILHEYLTESSVALLRTEFTELEDPYASDIGFFSLENISAAQILAFSNVPVAKLHDIRPKLFQILEKLCSDGLDMERMKLVIDRTRLKILDQLELSAHEHLPNLIILDCLYGDIHGKDLGKAVDEMQYIETIFNYTSDEWVKMLRTFMLDKPYYCVIGTPSATYAKKLQEDESQRLDAQRADLGEEKLKVLQKELEHALAENDVEIPPELLRQFPVPSYANIELPMVVTAQHPNLNKLDNVVQKHVGSAKTALPVSIQFDHIKSAFIEATAYVDTCSLNNDERLYMEVFLESFFNVPVLKDGVLLTHENVVKALNQDTMEFSNGLGYYSYGQFSGGAFGQLAHFALKVESSKYEKLGPWFQALLLNQVYNTERLKIATTKLLNDISPIRRDGYRMVNATLQYTVFNDQSNYKAASVMKQSKFLMELSARLISNPESVLAQIDAVRAKLFRVENLRFHIVGDVLSLKRPLDVWARVSWPLTSAPLAPIRYAHEFLAPEGVRLGVHQLVNMSTIESSFAVHIAKGLKDYNDPDLPALMVLNEMLSTMEGVFWKEIRGNGLAYSASVSADVEGGFLKFSISRSQDASKAFKAAKSIIDKLASGAAYLDPMEFENAKSSVVFAIISKVETASQAAAESFVNQVLKRVGPHATKNILKALDGLEIDAMYRVLKSHLVKLFDPATSLSCVVAAKSKLEDVKAGYAGLGWDMSVVSIDEIMMATGDDDEGCNDGACCDDESCGC